MISEEFFLQGDLEKELGIPVQPFTARDKVDKAFSQLGFIEYLCIPLYRQISHLWPMLAFYSATLCDNMRKWETEWLEGKERDEGERWGVTRRIEAVEESFLTIVSKVGQAENIDKGGSPGDGGGGPGDNRNERS